MEVLPLIIPPLKLNNINLSTHQLKKHKTRHRSNSSPTHSPRNIKQNIKSTLLSISHNRRSRILNLKSPNIDKFKPNYEDSSTDSEHTYESSHGDDTSDSDITSSSNYYNLTLSNSGSEEITCPSPNYNNNNNNITTSQHLNLSRRRSSISTYIAEEQNKSFLDDSDDNESIASSSSPSLGNTTLRMSTSNEGASSHEDKSIKDETPRFDGPEMIIGRGTYGVVKTINCMAYKYYDDWPCLVRELPCLISCQGPGVVEVYGYNPYKQCVRMKLYQTDLATWLSQNSSKQNLFKFRQHVLHNIIQGLVTIHSRGCVHGDLKPSNILLSSTIGIKITTRDYENSSSVRVVLADLGNVCPNGQGSIHYITPSHRPIVSSKHCPHLQHWVDVYALALVVMELWISDYDSWAQEVSLLQDNIPLDEYLTRIRSGINSPDVSPGRSVRHSQKLFVDLLLKHTSLTGRTLEYFTKIIRSCRQPDKIPNIYQVARDCGAKIISTACPLQYDVGGVLSPRTITIDCDTLGNLQQLISTTSPTPFIAQRSITVFRYVVNNMTLTVSDLAPTSLIIMRMISHLTSNNTTYSSLTNILEKIKCPRTVQQLLELEIKLLNDKGFCHIIILGYV